jgi:protein-disulfide isomerase
MNRAIRPLALALSVLTLLGGCKESVSDKAFGAKVRAYLLEHPEVLRETAEALDKKEALASADKLGQAIRINRTALERDRRDLVANPNGKITVVQFFDYNCTWCKASAPEVLAMIESRPDVRFVFKDWPVVGGADSERAARVAFGLRAGEKGDGLALYREFIAAKPLDGGAVTRITAANGLDAIKLETDAEHAGAEKYLSDTKALAQRLGLQGTPTFIIGDKVIEGADSTKLKAAIDAATS